MFGLDGSKVLGLGLNLKAWAYIMAGAMIVLLATFGAGYGFGHGSGEVAGVNSKQAEVDALKAAAARHAAADADATAKANAEAREKERKHEQEVADLKSKFAADQAAAHAVDARAIADLRNGNEWLRLRVTSCGAAGPSPLGVPGQGADDPAYAQLAPETAAAVYGIAADGDAAIRQANGLIDWAESAMKTCGAMPHKETKP